MILFTGEPGFRKQVTSFHAPVMTADFKLHPEFCRRDTDKGADTHSDMKDREPGAFHERCMQSDIHVWMGWIHSQRRNRLDQKLVEKLVRTHTNLALRESLDDTLRHLLPWDIELVIDEPVDEQQEEPEV